MTTDDAYTKVTYNFKRLITPGPDSAGAVASVNGRIGDVTGLAEASGVTTAVAAAVSALVNSAPSTLDTLGEIATALAADESTASALATTVGGKAAKSANLSDLANAATARTNLGAQKALTVTATKMTPYTAAVGELVMADASLSCRTVYDAVVAASSAVITSATANFVNAAYPAGDVGAPLTGTYVTAQLPGTSIISVQSATSATMSANTVAAVSGVTASIGSPAGLAITLPASAANGDFVDVRKTDRSGLAIVVAGSGGDTVNGAASVSLSKALTTTRFVKGTGTDWIATIAAPVATRGNIVNATGDSVAPPTLAVDGYMNGSGNSTADVLCWAHLLSNGRLLQGRNDGVNGSTALNNVARIDSACRMGGQWCMIQTGYNDATAAVTPAAWAGYIRQMVSIVLGRGMMPILTTPTPANTGATRLLMDKYRHWLISYAAANGYPLADFYSVLANPLTGTYKSGYDFGDGVHPNAAGKAAMGQALVDAMAPFLPAVPPGLPIASVSGTDSANLLPGGLFDVDTNADGVPDSWTKAGSQTVSLVTDAAVLGKALRISDTASAGYTYVTHAAGSGTGLAGHRFAFTGLVKVAAASNYVDLTLSLTGATVVTLSALKFWIGIATPGWQRFYVEGTFPTSPFSWAVLFDSYGGTSIDVQCAQLAVYDLTALGWVAPNG